YLSLQLPTVITTLTCFTASFFYNHTPPTHIYTLSLHDALPIWAEYVAAHFERGRPLGHGFTEQNLRDGTAYYAHDGLDGIRVVRSEEHTSELQSRENLVCRLLLEKKKQKKRQTANANRKM